MYIDFLMEFGFECATNSLAPFAYSILHYVEIEDSDLRTNENCQWVCKRL